MRPERLGLATKYLVIFLGGCIGTGLRVTVVERLASGATAWDRATLPWGTLTVNLVGAFLLGALVGVLAARFPYANPSVRLFLGTGILGSFTTYGTFVAEVDAGASPALYLAISLLGGFACAALGLRAGRLARRSSPAGHDPEPTRIHPVVAAIARSRRNESSR